jgi:type I restriction enzyme S subunit
VKYKPYPAYKDSGVEWLGEVPELWKIIPLKHAVTMKSGEQITSDDIHEAGSYPVFGGNGLRGYTERFTHEGRFPLVGRQGALCGNVNYASGQFWASEHAIVVSPKRDCAVTWLGELLRSMNLGQYSITAAQPGLSVEVIGNLRIPYPSEREQTAIATFLDRETAKLDTLIAKQEKLIELLQEKRQTLISHAVTKGLNPDVPMKDSGVEWLGEVPEHWGVKRLRFVGDAIIGLTYDPSEITDETEGVLVLRSSNVQGGRITFEDNVYVSTAIPEKLITQVGDILICSRNGSRALIGKNAKIDSDSAGVTFGAFMTVFRSDSNAFLFYVFNSMIFDYQAGSFMTSTVNQLTIGNLYGFEVPMPPIEEQSVIVEYLDQETAKLDSLIEKSRRSVELMREHRTALISAAVTGKIDVRNEQGLN